MAATDKVTRNGETLTARMWQELDAAYREVGLNPAADLQVSQGSWSGDVAASGSTHDGGGAVDLRTSILSVHKVEPLVNALRRMGVCAWERGEADGMSPHIHGIDRNEAGLSGGARSQVADYDDGLSGLSSGSKDRNPYRPKQTAYVYQEEDDVSAEEVWALKTEDPITGESISMRELLKRTRTVATQARDAAREAVELIEGGDVDGHVWEPDPGDAE